jgi:hypothetical protein
VIIYLSYSVFSLAYSRFVWFSPRVDADATAYWTRLPKIFRARLVSASTLRGALAIRNVCRRCEICGFLKNAR